jgi:hypothetical protein
MLLSFRMFKSCMPKKPRPLVIFSAWSLLTAAEYLIMQTIFSKKITDEPSVEVIFITLVLSTISIPLSALIDSRIKKCCERDQVQAVVNLPEPLTTQQIEGSPRAVRYNEWENQHRGPSDPREPDPEPLSISI